MLSSCKASVQRCERPTARCCREKKIYTWTQACMHAVATAVPCVQTQSDTRTHTHILECRQDQSCGGLNHRRCKAAKSSSSYWRRDDADGNKGKTVGAVGGATSATGAVESVGRMSSICGTSSQNNWLIFTR